MHVNLSRHVRHFCIGAIAISIHASVASAAPFGFAVDGTNLYSVDLGNGTETLIAPLGTSTGTGLAISPGGSLFAADVAGNLYDVNKTTGATTLIGSYGSDGDIRGLDFGGATLFAVLNEFNQQTVVSVNTATAALTDVVVIATDISTVRSVAVLDLDTVVVVSDDDGLGATGMGRFLHSVDLTNGSTSLLGALAHDTFAIDFGADGELYALASNGVVTRVNLSGGGDLVINSDTDGPTWISLAAVDAIPEPASLALLGLGAATLLLGRASRRRG
jgi:hypothetical protein